MSKQVTLYVYDLSGGLAKNLSRAIIGQQIDAIYHTGIVVYNKVRDFSLSNRLGILLRRRDLQRACGHDSVRNSSRQNPSGNYRDSRRYLY